MAAAEPSTTDRIAELEAQLAAARASHEAERRALEVERDQLRVAYQELQHELALMRRRLFAARSERLDTAQLELEFGQKLAALDALNRELGLALPGDEPDEPTKKPGKRKPTGRRDLRAADLPEERIELTDPAFETSAERIGWEESARVMWRRASFVRLIVARAKYRVGEGQAVAQAPPWRRRRHGQPSRPSRSARAEGVCRARCPCHLPAAVLARLQPDRVRVGAAEAVRQAHRAAYSRPPSSRCSSRSPPRHTTALPELVCSLRLPSSTQVIPGVNR